MKKKFLFIALLMAGALAFAQVSVDPQHKFYTQVERWETLGIILRQPSLRPYPLHLVEEILTEVVESTNELESENAKELYEEIFGKKWNIKVELQGNVKKGSNNKDIYYALYGLDGDIPLFSNMALGYTLDFLSTYLHNGKEGEEIPAYRRLHYMLADNASSTALHNYMEVDGSYSAFYKNFYLQAGINHTDFGPFYDESIVLSPDAKHAPVIAMSYKNNIINYSQGMIFLTATPTDRDSRYPGKYFMFHSLEANITKKFSASFYETVVYGNRFDISYMIPMLYMVTQGVTGFDEDNILMGATMSYRPINGLLFNADFYLDDVGFTGIKEYKDFKLHAAGAAGVKYVPENSKLLKLLKLDYVMVTPFMYPHGQHIFDKENNVVSTGKLSAVNYQAYTQAGECLGATLDPNSDKLKLSATLNPVKNLELDLGAVFIRHANVNEGLSNSEKLYYLTSEKGYFITDGSIKQSAMLRGDNFLNSSQHKVMFLTQPTKEYIFQGDIKASYNFPKTSFGNMTLALGYTFEYIHNYGVGNELYPAESYYEKNGLYYTSSDYSGTGYTAEEAISRMENAWKAQLKNLINHYVTIDFTYRF